MAGDVNTGNFFSDFYCLKTGATSNRSKCEACLQHFDLDGDGCLDRREFRELLKDLFVQNGGAIDKDIETQIFDILDDDKDGKLDANEFLIAWRYWLKQVLEPVTALIIVDVQHDFIDGSLALKQCPSQQDGFEVVPVINNLIDTVPFDLVIYTKDWHPGNHISFADNAKMRPFHYTSPVLADDAKLFDNVVFDVNGLCINQTLWPVHCVQGSQGAALHKDLKFRHDGIVVNKGTNPDIDSYSAFWDNGHIARTELGSILKKNRVTDVYVCGLAYDICAGFTAIDAISHGFRTVFIDDACRGVTQQDMDKTKASLVQKGAVIALSSQVRRLVVADDRRLELGYRAALNLQLAKQIVKSKSAD